LAPQTTTKSVEDMLRETEPVVHEFGFGGTDTEVVYETGGARSDSTGKGRYDLISPLALRRLALVYEKGGLARGDRNWEKGMPRTRLFDSALRHVFQALEGQTDEDHLAHAAWNLFALMHFEETGQELPEA
jgi:hypothetical protein